MARKPNYEFERRERNRLKTIKNAEKATAKKEAKERAKAEAGGIATPGEVDPNSATTGGATARSSPRALDG